ncbi:hypothetical protein PFISCL1PPCAC_21355, partial [Pristionchus fissidentatus]
KDGFEEFGRTLATKSVTWKTDMQSFCDIVPLPVYGGVRELAPNRHPFIRKDFSPQATNGAVCVFRLPLEATKSEVLELMERIGPVVELQY